MASEIASPERIDDETSVGIVQTQIVRLFEPSAPLTLEGGRQLGPINVAFETYGELTPEKDNAIFVCHALTGDAHVAGKHSPDDRKSGWWDGLVGPGKALDTRKYFIVCANVLGGCQGTTGPSCPDPATGQPYGLRFPFITVGDMVEVHAALVRHLGIEKLLAVIGGSLGGMQVLDWVARYPDMMHAAICLASAAKLSAQGIAFNAVGRRAITTDPQFQNGDYYGAEPSKYGDVGPRAGLALARMVAHITYLSEASIERKFGRDLQHSDHLAYDLQSETEFKIESYLHYQGKRFIERFDANSYVYLTRAMDYFDLAQRYGSLRQALGRTEARFLITSYHTDWLFPSSQSRELVSALLQTHRHVTYLELESVFGHDSFLLEIKQLEELVTPLLRETYRRLRHS
ncbi:homoserine O-acetyltransferase MetX [Schlesneria paludicola]|uniref:homoserine O-acetyltransferase MetX n=1 Tax=Schlesneria paludicola TaxID=360056 RepID=UPI00029AF04D|nr:homoserine O-acetyltransferase [Schlesneria paludicola]